MSTEKEGGNCRKCMGRDSSAHIRTRWQLIDDVSRKTEDYSLKITRRGLRLSVPVSNPYTLFKSRLM